MCSVESAQAPRRRDHTDILGSAAVVNTGGSVPIRKPTILIVCTGNVCRSPAAEFLLADLLGATAKKFTIRSAGTRAVAKLPIDPTICSLLRRRGIETIHFSSRELEVRMLETADLIVTASTNHRAAVARLRPAALHKTLTLKQLARYAPYILESGNRPTDVNERIAWLLAGVPRARARARKDDDDSIADPRGKSRRHYEAAIEELESACAVIAGLLGDVTATGTEKMTVGAGSRS
jgi:protein-tyrosine phosphatase